MTITSDLEVNRAEELDQLLDLVKPKILEFIEKSDFNSDKYEGDSLGKYHSPQFLKLQFEQQDSLVEGIKGDKTSLSIFLDKVLKYSVNTWNPGFLDKLYASNNPIGVISDIILSILNTNSHVYTVSPVLSVLENKVGKSYAQKFFENDQDTCGGLTFSGGSWSNITSLQMARALKFPDTKDNGNANYKFAVYTSKHCHYSVEKAAILLGLGSKNVFKVDVNNDGSMNMDSLKQTIETSKLQGFTPLYINATAGTTVFGSYDPFEQISQLAKQHDIWFHIDGSWGGNIIFSEKHKYKLNGSKFSDSITVNPHKMLGIPNTCSFLLVPHVGNFQKSMSLSAPYLFHGRESGDEDMENFDLADGTMGCGRRADAFKFYLGWLYFGSKGFEARVNHAFNIVEYFVKRISDHEGFELVINDPQCLQVCFYYKPPTYNKQDYTDVTRYVSRELHKQGKYLVDFSPNPSDSSKGEFFRVVFNSPILTDAIVDNLVDEIVSIGRGVEE